MITVIEDKSDENIIKLTEIVFDKFGVGGDLVIESWYIDKIYVTEEGREYMIKIWNVRKNSKGRFVIDWTLYRIKLDGSCADKIMGSGKTVMKNKKEEGRT